MRRARRGALIVSTILLVVGHVAYWYLPRERSASLPSSSLTQAVLDGSGLPTRLWVAYPHQNLGFLQHGDSAARWRTGLADLAGVPELELPRFGPFALPPASDLAVATDAAGERMVLAARIYPLIAGIARLAGKLAGNPWLAGGVIEERDRSMEVRWQGRTWMLRTQGQPWPTPHGGGSADEPALARLGLDDAVGPIPPGDYLLQRRDQGLDLVSKGASAEALERPQQGSLMMVERRRGGLRATAILGPGEGSLRGLPSAVVVAQPGASAGKLPFQRVYRVLGIERRRVTVRGWTIVASDRLALRRGQQIRPGLERRIAGVVPRLSYEIDLDIVRAVSADLEARLQGIPLPRIREIARWRGAATILRELGGYSRWSLEVDADGTTVRSRLWLSETQEVSEP